MSSKRKDNKGRVLHNGEYQQKNGRYRYKYYDCAGKERYLYSWRLDKNDRMPEGKKYGPSLREQEKELQTMLSGHIALNGGNLTVLELVRRYITREAITRDEERRYLEFVKQDKHFGQYYEGIFILFNTGLRISEFVGLTIKNIDFKHHKIIVNHQLIRTSKMQYIIEEPKTGSGVREIPMSYEVEEAFRRIIAKRVKPKVEPMIGGYSGFLYLDKNNMPMVALHWQKYFQHILKKYNSIYKIQMPKVTPHVCRHTFCSKVAKSGMNPKSLQYIMGHSDIGVALNTYTHVKFEDAEAEMKRVAIV